MLNSQQIVFLFLTQFLKSCKSRLRVFKGNLDHLVSSFTTDTFCIKKRTREKLLIYQDPENSDRFKSIQIRQEVNPYFSVETNYLGNFSKICEPLR